MVQKIATVHEKTVQAIARDEIEPSRVIHRRYSGRSSTVSVTRAHPLLMMAARRALAAGSYTRIEVVSATEAWVR